ncbi:creatininase family protein [Nakamurella endophytica]|uniref:Creatinine amidohydrolase n=1 Tax=Nakamurella endophytica TaxID=1748367 RepID=A0A917SLD0_9ACTN|nr:creatininase family protein [Nakamurella endophytica]GGL85346.1 creatinine amidohydrolase [Nakamurella endophytica]
MSHPHSAAWPDAARALGRGALPILPFGAHEQHGPHLPLATDTVMAAGLAGRIAEQVDGWLLPAVTYGHTVGNDGFPGTVSLSFETVRAVAADICRALVRQGARGVVVVNGDFGNRAPLELAAQQVRAETSRPVLVVNYPGLAEIAAELCTTAPAGWGLMHADEFETSVVLALEPEHVRMERAVAEYPDFPATFPELSEPLHRLSRSGVFGDPTPATAELGRRLLDRLTDRAVALVSEFRRALPAANPPPADLG